MALMHAALHGVMPAQEPTAPPNIGVTLDDPAALLLGIGGGVVRAGDEAFEGVVAGYAVQLFAGAAWAPFDELRVGVALASHADDLSQDRTTVVSLYIEPYLLACAVGRVRVRVGPRIAWMQESRSIYIKALRGIGLGGIVGTHLRVGARGAIETAVAVTPFRFGAADIPGAPPDPDRESYALVWEARLGFAFRPVVSSR